MAPQLRREPGVRRFPVAQRARAEQLGNSRDVAFGIIEVLTHLSFVGPDERRGPRLHPGVASQALQGVAAPRLAVARVEQDLEPLENVSWQVEVGNEEA